jgi:hypothetical protein
LIKQKTKSISKSEYFNITILVDDKPRK